MKFQIGEGLDQGVDEDAWSAKYDCWFFSACGMQGGESRSPRKIAAVKKNLEKANAARRAKAEAGRRQKASESAVPPEDLTGFPKES